MKNFIQNNTNNMNKTTEAYATGMFNFVCSNPVLVLDEHEDYLGYPKNRRLRC